MNQLNDNTNLQAQFMETIHKFILTQTDPFRSDLLKLFNNTRHISPLKYPLKHIDYTSYLKKTAERAGRF